MSEWKQPGHFDEEILRKILTDLCLARHPQAIKLYHMEWNMGFTYAIMGVFWNGKTNCSPKFLQLVKEKHAVAWTLQRMKV